jgi:hypothetical protein
MGPPQLFPGVKIRKNQGTDQRDLHHRATPQAFSFDYLIRKLEKRWGSGSPSR